MRAPGAIHTAARPPRAPSPQHASPRWQPRPQQVATHAAVELRADKLLLLTGQDVRDLELPHYLPLVRLAARSNKLLQPGCCVVRQLCVALPYATARRLLRPDDF